MDIHAFLEQKQISCEVIAHPATYDAQRMAQAVHVSGHHVAKTVLLRVGPQPHYYAVAILPASHHLDLEKTRQALGAASVELATEPEMLECCPDCEIGALPPFGSQYGMDTVLDELLAQDQDLLFEGSSHEEAVKMSLADFKRLESPTVAPITA